MKNYWSNIRGFLVFSLIFILVFMADALLVYVYYSYVNKFVEEQPDNVKADAGIVFFGDYTSKGNSLGPDSKNRAKQAITLYNKGLINAIVCVGGYDISKWKGKTHLMKRFLVNQGIPAQRILHDSLSYNTNTNWEEACKIMKRNHFDTVIAISSPMHVFRISKLVRSDTVFYSAYSHHPDGIGDYWQIFKDVHHEFMSQFLSFALKDRVRNRIVRIYRTLWFELDKVL